MGIDIRVRWKGQSDSQKQAQAEVWLNTVSGHIGYLREAYHGTPYATLFLFREVFQETSDAKIPAAVLLERLPEALQLIEERETKLYNSTVSQIEEVKQSFRDFVALCEAKEKETGELVTIEAWY